MQNLFQELVDLLSVDDRLVSEGKLMKNKVVELALNLDPLLLKHLLKSESLKKHFFGDIDGVLIFDKIKFQKFVSNKKFLPDSFTAFKNKVGLDIDDRYFSDTNEVVLAWPYKDCILEGGQDKEDAIRKEVFWNETLAPDQIDRLMSPKALCNFRKNATDKLDANSIDFSKSNFLVKGNNLLVLNTLLREFSEEVKLIYIDPPYNTDNDSFLYNDSFNHSTWLTFMKNRLSVARKFLMKDGVIFVQCDDNEQAYLKVLMDEEFGADNFLNTVSVNMKNTSGASGGGEDKRLKKNIEYIHIYTKERSAFSKFNEVFDEENLFDVIDSMRDEGKSWKYTRALISTGEREFLKSVVDGSGEEIKIFIHKNVEIKTIKELMREDGIDEKTCYVKYYDSIFRDTNAQSSIRTRVMEATNGLGDFFSIEYVPRSGKSKGKQTSLFYKGNNCDLLAWLKDTCIKKGEQLIKLEKLGTYWDFVGETKNLTKEGGVEFLSGKKPEKLIQRIIELCTDEGDLVLDYHLGSGTTAAVAHKTNRRYIGVEQLDYGNDDSTVRLRNVINGDQSGISKSVNWTGGGEFIYCELAKANQVFVDAIDAAKSSEELLAIWNTMQERAFLSYRVDLKAFGESSGEFVELGFADQKRFLIETLDKNMLYVPLSEIDDTTYEISEQDKTLNKKFFG